MAASLRGAPAKPALRSSAPAPLPLLLPSLGFAAFAYLLSGAVLVMLSLGQDPAAWGELSTLDASRYLMLLGDDLFLNSLLQTFILGAAVGLLSLLLGYPVAYFLARGSSWFQGVLLLLILLPMAVGSNMLALGWLVMLGRQGLVNSLLGMLGLTSEPLALLYNWPSLIIGLTHDALAFMVLPIASVIKGIDPSLERAARNLGASPVRTFLTVTLPLTLDGVAAGFLLVFMLVSGSLVLPLVLGGPSVAILPMLIYQQITVVFDPNTAAAMAVVLLVFALTILFIQLKLATRR